MPRYLSSPATIANSIDLKSGVLDSEYVQNKQVLSQVCMCVHVHAHTCARALLYVCT